MLIKSFPHVCQTQVAFAETLDAKIVSGHHSNQHRCSQVLSSVLSLPKLYDMKIAFSAGKMRRFCFPVILYLVYENPLCPSQHLVQHSLP